MTSKWIRVETDLVDHPKVLQLCELLENSESVAFVLRLWTHTSRFYPSGKISVSSQSVTRDVTLQSRVTSIVTACRWSGDKEKFISALLCCGFLDKTEDGYEVHDWAVHQGKVASGAEKARIRQQNYRAKLKAQIELSRVTSHNGDVLSQRDNRDGDALRDGTGRDGTGRNVINTLSDSQTATVPPLKAKKEQSDARVTELTKSLVSVFESKTGHKYHHHGAKDAKALKSLLAHDTPEEIIRRWQVGLSSTGWHRTVTFAQLGQKWNDLGTGKNSTAPIMGVSPENVWREGMAPINEEIIL